MLLELQDEERFIEDVQHDTLILTPNHRTSVALQESYGRLRKQRGESLVCPFPRILPIDIWARHCHDELSRQAALELPALGLLSPQHEVLIWRDIIRSGSTRQLILNPEATARTASEAYTLMQQWHMTPALVEQWLQEEWQLGDDSLDITAFLEWVRLFEAALAKYRLQTLSGLIARLVELLQQQQAALPRDIIPASVALFGFHDTPPLYQALLDELRRQADTTTFHALRPGSPPVDIFHTACQTEAHEVQEAAHWARDILRREKEVSIGIICQNPGARQDSIQRIFSHVFAPDSMLETPSELPFDISAGTPLDAYPLIRTALDLLSLNQWQLPTLTVCRLLRSVFISGAEAELRARTALENRLRDLGESFIRPAHLRSLAHQEKAGYHCPRLTRSLQQFVELYRPSARELRSSAQWLPLIQQQLVLMGWPGDRRPDDAENRQLQQWQELLDRFQESRTCTEPMSYQDALGVLAQLAANTRHRDFRLNAPIQVLAPAEAEGLQFTHLWLMGMNEGHWPPPMQVNNFIPLRLQQEFDLPRSRGESHFQYYAELLQSLISNTRSTVRLSYVQMQDELESRMASLALDSSSREPDTGLDTGLHPHFHALARAPAHSDFEDVTALPLGEEENPGGGSSLIANQATCPFRSFAIHRLRARQLETTRYGLDPRDTGTMIHQAMESIWQDLQSHRQLLNTEAEELKDKVEKHAGTAVMAMARKHPQLMQSRFCELETRRLGELLLNWLEQEKERVFSEIIALEQQLEWQHGQLQLKLKLDRVEKGVNGSLSIIDYKTGTPRATLKWLDERPEQPQLALYLLAAEKLYGRDSVVELLFAWINVDKNSFRGIRLDEALPGDLDAGEFRQHLEHTISAMAEEFQAGVLTVTPKSANACKHCHVKPLCRIDDRDKRDFALAEEDSEDSAYPEWES